MRFMTTTAFLVLATAATAQTPLSACAKMKDATGCVCAAATGGMVSATSWSRGPDRTAFEACLAARGSAPPNTRPTTISARP